MPSKKEILTVLLQKINEQKIQLYELEMGLKKNYQAYRDLDTQQHAIEVENVQKTQLSNSTAMLEFFVGERQVFILGITQNDLFATAFPKDDLDEKVKQFCQLLKASNTERDELFFAEKNQEISQKLLFPILKKLPESINELIIIPDGQLAYLPFDILLTEPVHKAVDLPYLLKRYAISYANSATLFALQNTPNQTFSSNKLIGFAPKFHGTQLFAELRSCNADGLSPLDFNEVELERITQSFTGEIITGNMATVANFLAKNQDCRILHLATHACVDDEDASQSRIYFTDDYLYAHELYNLQIPAEMVVLSACETGVGTYAKGEGMMSLARGFSYSGIPSITTTLWSVNDETTAELMGYLYQNLAAGQPKHIALQQAKLSYLKAQNSQERLSPIYWAGFVHYGRTTPVVSAFAWKKWVGLSLLLLLGLSIFWWRKNAKSG